MDCVDTHAHIYDADEVKYPKIAEPLRPPEGTGGIEHLKRETAAHQVGRVVLIQTGSAYRWDNRLLADVAAANRTWTRGVCTLDTTAEASVEELERLAEQHNVKGLRLEPSRSEPPADHHDGALRLWEKARDLGVVICAHLQGPFGELARLLAAFPQVPVVLDHCAYPKPDAADKTADQVAELSRFDNLYAKLSFAVTASAEAYPCADTYDLLQRMIAAFGPERCMWGSGFPCELWLKKATYGQHLDVFRSRLGLSPAEKEAILSATPLKVWFGE